MTEPTRGRLRRMCPDLGRRTLIMGILNATPDSFSDGGVYLDPDKALDRALAMMDAGADVIDVGGESTRPGSDPVSVDEELRRVIPVIERLAARRIGPISIDTTKSEVARRALEAGASIVNDVSGFEFDGGMPAVVAAAKAPVVVMHTRARPKEMMLGKIEYEGGVVEAVKASLAHALSVAEAAGTPREDVILDPGIGFGKTLEQNLTLLRELGALRSFGCPILVGTSRKSFLGKLTGREVGSREFATASTVALSIAGGADLVRVHDVQAMGDVVRVADAIVRRRPDAGGAV